MKKLFVMLSVVALFAVACNSEVKDVEAVGGDTVIVNQVDTAVVDTLTLDISPLLFKVDTVKVVK